MIEDNEREIHEALASDLGRDEMENCTTDVMGIKMDILDHINNVEKWAVTGPVPGSDIVGFISRARIRRESRGVMFVIGTWNFPFILTLQPVIAAIAAGCCVVIKLSELATASERSMASLVSKYMDQSCIRLVTGGPEETTRFLEHKFDHILFTGSTKIARFVAAAAKHLTPVTLELGGQCPAIITKTADIELSAKRIALATFSNAGQICLSVNHVLIGPAVHDAFVARLEHWTRKFTAAGQMCRIMNQRNHDRLTSFLDKSHGTIIRCGPGPSGDCGMAPVIVTGVKTTDAIMTEELFGPICPVIACSTEDTIAVTNNLPRPLALYIFSSDKKETEYIQDRAISGGVTINDTLFHAGIPNAPFGGVGDSGMGFFHGEHGFLSFTHLRTVAAPPTWLDRFMGFRYPPFDTKNKGMFAISNMGKFQRGETLQDQKVGFGRPWRRAALGLCLAACLAYYYRYPAIYERALSYARNALLRLNVSL
ncbi:hypothetical protein COCVIDRAFT_26610 [Bipolaris victoriae FI3]|uniref:Aldehyde dehydrogenase n=1 Tax=Bipolaris victoriae (strain FI3) TaxID=930091 RepID=W7EJQ0_BIPV3|nr:hypothetical protein COCVIDRAFT_26610 [Bipolaris victoriae FI3]